MNSLLYTIVLVVLVLLLLGPQDIHGAENGKKKDYSNHQLLRIKLNTKQDLDTLISLLPNQNPELVDIWTNECHLTVGTYNDILLERKDAARVISALNRGGGDMMVQMISSNVQRDLLLPAKQVVAANDDYFADYRDYNVTMDYLKKIQSQYAQLSTLIHVGTSWEGRDILALKISTSAPGEPQRNIVYFDSMIHSREWIGVPVTMYALTQILEGYAKQEPRITNILDKVDIIFIPIMNPDGFQYSHTSDRLWRKNRRNNKDGTFGVDLNRNWPTGFGVGASNSTRSDVYNGPGILSEPETSAVFKFLKSFNGAIKAGIDFHSYSQLVLRPWDYSSKPCPDEKELNSLGEKMHGAIKSVNKEEYRNIRGSQLYPAGGAMNDDMYANQKMAGFTIELRDKGRHGFVLPANQIMPTVKENFEAIMVLCEWVVDGGSVKGI